MAGEDELKDVSQGRKPSLLRSESFTTVLLKQARASAEGVDDLCVYILVNFSGLQACAVSLLHYPHTNDPVTF